MKTDLMIDLETLGTAPGCAIVSIGAVRFDRDGGDWPADAAHEFYVRVDLENCQRVGLKTEAATLEWWMERADKWPSPRGGTADLIEAIRDFYCFVASIPKDAMLEVPGDLRIWCHGASFDVPILAAACQAISWPVLWSHRSIRDTRTLFDLAGYEYRTTSHHALEDARQQARAVQAAMRKLRGTP